MLCKGRLESRYVQTRREYFGGSMHGLVEVPPLSLVQGSTMSFFLFHHVYAHQGPKVERLIGWGHSEIIDKLKYKGVTLFVDGTFRCVPRSFYQFVVIMVHDQASDCLLPAFYVLCSLKEPDMYWNVIDHVIQAIDQKLELSKVICDFEAGLIKAVIWGCFNKQWMRRYGPELWNVNSIPKLTPTRQHTVRNAVHDGRRGHGRWRPELPSVNATDSHDLHDMAPFMKTALGFYLPPLLDVYTYTVYRQPLSFFANPLQSQLKHGILPAQ
ncbi:hypothetical protein PHMEG_00015290 [Phytophthora megakarya]|uniref:MULE transposase domain-containing protein n=1 Tax=Phytophthora megakarya TaxID=4795 RepID=A0A225W493_9STRA|nr:hypothetical protein PHMEG_00015290 [Phytophthora megakarya]